MTTKFIGTKELRQNLFSISKEVGKGRTAYVVMNKNKPVFTMRPFLEEDVVLMPSKRLRQAIKEAEGDYAKGKLKGFTNTEDLLDHLNS